MDCHAQHGILPVICPQIVRLSQQGGGMVEISRFGITQCPSLPDSTCHLWTGPSRGNSLTDQIHNDSINSSLQRSLTTDSCSIRRINGTFGQPDGGNTTQRGTTSNSYLDSAILAAYRIVHGVERQSGAERTAGTRFGRGSGIEPNARLVNQEELELARNFLTAVALFMPGRVGVLGTIICYALGQARPQNSALEQVLDLSLGAGRGLLTRAVFASARCNHPLASIRGILTGASIRAIDTGLDRRTYWNNHNQHPSLALGLQRLGDACLDPGAIASDAIIFGAAHRLTALLRTKFPGKVEGNVVLGHIANATLFGLTTGCYNEIASQFENAGSRDRSLSAMARNAVQRGIIDGLAAIPGGIYGRRPGLLLHTQGQSQKLLDFHPTAATSGSLIAENTHRGCSQTSTSARAFLVHHDSHNFLSNEQRSLAVQPHREALGLTHGKRVEQTQNSQAPNAQLRVALDTTNRSIRNNNLDQLPLNVVSGSGEKTASLMSNFAHTPFVLDGRTYGSVEGFYQSLKFSDPLKRIEVAGLWGRAAKRAGGRSQPSLTEYNGQTLQLGSAEHHELIKRAIRGKLDQHPDLAREFAATHPRPIQHDLGHPESSSTKLPARDFVRILTELRDELVQHNTTTSGKSLPAPSNNLSEALKRTLDQPAHEHHNVELYARAFALFHHRVNHYIGAGSDSIVFRLENGNVLKLTQRNLTSGLGNRPFDLPILERGTRIVDGIRVSYFIQPFAEAVSPAVMPEFRRQLSSLGYEFTDARPNQLGSYAGSIRLLDYWAVQRIA